MGLDPVTMTGIAMLSSFASTAVGISQQMRAGQDQKAWADYNARVMENEAVAARQQASLEAEARRKQGLRLVGSQRAGLAKSGVELSSGSPLSLLEETATENELAIQTIKWAGEQQARRALSAATAARIKGEASSRASYWGAGTTLLTGGLRTMGYGARLSNTYGTSGYGKKSSIVEEDLYE